MKTPIVVSTWAVALCLAAVATHFSFATADSDDGSHHLAANEYFDDEKIRAPRSAAAFYDAAVPDRELYDRIGAMRSRRSSWFHKVGKLVTAPFRKAYRLIRPKKYEKYKQFYKYNKYKQLRKFGKYNKYKNFYKLKKYSY